jgi:hypothetical protein
MFNFTVNYLMILYANKINYDIEKFIVLLFNQ